MAWKSYALGSLSADNALPAAASILNEIFESCVADTTARTITLTHGGTSYTVPSDTNYPTAVYDRVLFVNDATGAFVIGRVQTYVPHGQRGVYEFMTCALLEIQTGEAQTELVPIPTASFSKGYYEVFSVPYTSGTSSSNATSFITLTPVMTQQFYNASVTNALYRPIVGLFTSNVKLTVGTTVEVAGQQFICIACGLFAKL